MIASKIIQGESISPGAACGPLHFVGRFTPPSEPDSATAQGPADEIDRFHRQVSVLSREIEESVAALENESLSAEAQIMRAHLAMLHDPEFHRQVHELVRGTRYAAEAAVEHVLEDMATMMGASDSPAVGHGQALDPICKMVVSVKDNPHVLRVGGARHYFCSAGCMRQFLAARGSQMNTNEHTMDQAQGDD